MTQWIDLVYLAALAIVSALGGGAVGRWRSAGRLPAPVDDGTEVNAAEVVRGEKSSLILGKLQRIEDELASLKKWLQSREQSASAERDALKAWLEARDQSQSAAISGVQKQVDALKVSGLH